MPEANKDAFVDPIEGAEQMPEGAVDGKDVLQFDPAAAAVGTETHEDVQSLIADLEDEAAAAKTDKMAA